MTTGTRKRAASAKSIVEPNAKPAAAPRRARKAAPAEAPAAAPAVETPKAPRPAGKSRFAGQKLYPSAKVKKDGNPRRKDSHGFRSMEIIIANPGIAYEDYLSKGGRRDDIDWDVKFGNAVLRAR